MRKIKNIHVIFALFLIAFPTAIHAQSILPSIPLRSVVAEKDYIQGEIIIKYKDITKQLSAIQEFNSSSKEHADLKIKKFKSDTKSTQALLKEFENNPDVDYVEPNYKRNLLWDPNDAYFNLGIQWSHYNVNDNDIDSTNAWDIESATAQETIIAVIDSGINYTHEDLDQNLWNKNEGGPYGYDFVDNDDDPADTPHSDPDFQGHGTHVSSIFSSTTDNSIGKAGISRYNTIKVMALRFDLDTASTIEAINFAKNNGVKVINASFGGSGYSQLEKDAIASFPGILVTAAGNDSKNNDNNAMYPCNYNLDNIICVGATNRNDELASFSNYSNTHVDIAAPGDAVVIAHTPTTSCSSKYCQGSGTSYSTPFVAGTIALMYAHKPTASASTIRNTLLHSSDHLISLNDKIVCERRLNVSNALQSIINDLIPLETCRVPIHRFYSRKYQSHLYTSSESEKNNIINNWPTDIWEYQRVELLGYDKTASDVSPVYRFWSKKYRTLYYTTIESERDDIIKNWPDEIWEYQGPRLYVYTTSSTNRVPVYRMWSKKYKASYFTTNTNQRDCMIKKYPDYIWRYENISWWVPKESLDSSVITKC